MRIVRRTLGLGLALTLCAASLGAQFDPDAYYVSVPFTTNPGIYEVNATTGVATPFAVPLGIPHYGWFGNDGNFYVPDRAIPGVLKILPDGTVEILSQGGHFVFPVTCIPNPADDAWTVADMGSHKILRLDYDGTQTLLHDATSTGGLLDWPDGMAYDDDGNLFVANLGNNKIIKIDTAGNATVFADDPNLISQPGAVLIDGGGNLFVANYDLQTIARFRLDTGEGEVFAGPDSTKMATPNDMKFSRKGGILVSGRNGRVTHVDALGNLTVMAENPQLSELDGVSVLSDDTVCSGRFTNYGTGKVGSGGFMPQFRTLFAPCSGHTIALEFRDFLGGTQALLLVSGAPLENGVASFVGAPLLIDPGVPPFLAIPLFLPGSGPGEGDLTLQFQVPIEAGLEGLKLYHQAFALDTGVTFHVSATNGMLETWGL